MTVDIEAIRRTLGALRLDVIDAASGDRVPRIMLHLRRLGSDTSAKCDFTSGAEDDTVGTTFTFDDLPPGHYELRAEEVWPSSVGVPVRTGATRVEVTAGRRSHVVLRLYPAGRILLRLIDEHDRPTSPTGTIVDYRDDHDRAFELGTNRHGLGADDPEVRHLAGAPPGHGFILYEGQVQRVWVESAETTEVVMHLAPRRDVELRWPAPRPDHEGRPIEIVHLALLTPDGTTLSEEPVCDIEVDEELAFLQLPAGQYILRLTCREGRVLERQIVVPARDPDMPEEGDENDEPLVLRLQ